MIRKALPCTLFLVVGACSTPQSQDTIEIADISAETLNAAESITELDVLQRIGALAHDSTRGRNTPSPELNKVAEWIAAEFRAMGLQPGAGDGEFLQWYTLNQSTVASSGVRIQVGNAAPWQVGRHVANFSGATAPEGLTAPIVILTGQLDSLSDLEALDTQGAVVLWMASNDPTMARTTRFAARALTRAGALAVGLVTQPADTAWTRMASAPDPTSLQASWRASMAAPTFEVRESTVRSWLSQNGIDLSTARQGPLTATRIDETMSIMAPQSTTELRAPNVVALIEGSDATLKHEYIVYSAHIDHIGAVGQPFSSCRPSGTDRICNGADDDASGTATIMEVAQAFTQLSPAPRRSIVFLGVSGEEKGLLGSDYFANNPTVPLANIVANLNADMVGRNWPDTIVAIGKEHSDLGAILNAVNGAHPELHMTAIDDLWPDENFYRRSDHFNFARRGVPILFFFNGTHDEYHRAGDQVEMIDGEKTARIGRLLFYLGVELANRDARPTWNPESYREIVDRN